MLAESGGHKIYKRYDDDKLAQQYYVGAADYGYLPPEKRVRYYSKLIRGWYGAGVLGHQ